MLIIFAYKLKIDSVHIVNEQVFFLVYPLSFFKRCVLDQFDSIFYNRLSFLRKVPLFLYFFYKPLSNILVTDINRKNLMPLRYHNKILILPNYPFYRANIIEKEESKDLSILYFGWLGKSRGSEVINGLLGSKNTLRIISAGWIGTVIQKFYLKNMLKILATMEF